MPNGTIISQQPEFPTQSGLATSGQYLLLDGVVAADVGIWMRWPFSKGSMEVIDDGSWAGEVELQMSNAAVQPPNGWQIVVGGTAHTGDKLEVDLLCPSFTNGKISASYTVLGGDSLDDAAAGLNAAINAAIAAASQQYTFPEDQAFAAAAFDSTVSTATLTIVWRGQLSPVDIAKSVTGGGATTTLTVTQYDDGEGVVIPATDVTAAGAVAFNLPMQWIKAVAVSVGAGAVSVIANGSSP